MLRSEIVNWLKGLEASKSYILISSNSETEIIATEGKYIEPNEFRIVNNEFLQTSLNQSEINLKLRIENHDDSELVTQYASFVPKIKENNTSEVIVLLEEVEDFQIDQNLDLTSVFQRSLPSGISGLNKINQSLAFEILKNNKYGTLVTIIGGRVYSNQIQFKIVNETTLTAKSNYLEEIKKHLYYSPECHLIINTEDNTLFEFKLESFNLDPFEDENGIKLRLIEFSYGSKSTFEIFSFPNNEDSKIRKLESKIIRSLKYWFHAIRAHLLPMSFLPVLLGALLVNFMASSINYPYLVLSLCAVIFVHSGANLLNDYYDESTDNLNLRYTSTSRSQRMLQVGLLSPKKLLSISVLFSLLGILIGLYLNFKSNGNFIIYLGIIGLASALFYSLPPFKLSRLPFSEFILVLTFGPLPVIGSYYLHVNKFDNEFELIGIGTLLGLLVIIPVTVNNYLSSNIDIAVGKKTTTTLLNREKLQYYLLFLMITYVVLSLLLVISLNLPILLLTSNIVFFQGFRMIQTLNHTEYENNENIYTNSKRIYLLGAIILVLSFAFS